MAYRYQPKHPVARVIFYGFWYYFLGQLLDLWFGGHRHPWLLTAYYWTIGIIFALLVCLTFFVGWKTRKSQ
jgi:hypothetical protein